MPRFNKDKLLHIGYVVGAFASTWSVSIALLVQYQYFSWQMVIVSGIVIVLMIWAIIAVVKSETPTRTYSANDESGIRNYLFRWIKNGGRVAIWTRNMSWAEDSEMNQLLLSKAQAKELIICLPNDITKSDYLKLNGAEVVAYDTWDAPAVSFTIINYNRAGSRVAVGRASGNKHIIQEFSEGEHPAYYMAYDLVRMVRERHNADP